MGALFHFDGKADAADAPIIFLLTGDEDGARVCDAYAAQGIETTFERNPGNHFQDAELRLAKGVAWILEGAQT